MTGNRVICSRIKALSVALLATMFFSSAAMAFGASASQQIGISSSQIVKNLEWQARADGIKISNISIHENYKTDNGDRVNPNAVQGCTVSATAGVPPHTLTVSVTADTCEEAAAGTAAALPKAVATITP